MSLVGAPSTQTRRLFSWMTATMSGKDAPATLTRASITGDTAIRHVDACARPR